MHKKFQFPSNGKVYPKAQASQSAAPILSFNSLQTGKYIQRHKSKTRFSKSARVSIPFKRESISKGKKIRAAKMQAKLNVSIPFKRESISKG